MRPSKPTNPWKVEKYYELQNRTNRPSSYTPSKPPRIVSEYEIGKGVLGQANTYTGDIWLVDSLTHSQREKVNAHEKRHIHRPFEPEELVRDKTQTWQV